MRLKSGVKHIWRKTGLRARLLLPIALILLSAGSIRSYFLVVDEREAAISLYQEELSELHRYLTPVLVEQSIIGDYAAIKQTLSLQTKARANLDSIKWHYLNNALLVNDPTPAQLEAPAWFVRFVDIVPVTFATPITFGGENYGELKFKTTPVPAINKIWVRFTS